jgi:hypothetical protein
LVVLVKEVMSRTTQSETLSAAGAGAFGILTFEMGLGLRYFLRVERRMTDWSILLLI